MGDEKSKKEWNENYIKEHYNTVKEGLALFQEDPLIYEPGKGSEYSSLAYSLVSHLIEETSGVVFGYYFSCSSFVDINIMMIFLFFLLIDQATLAFFDFYFFYFSTQFIIVLSRILTIYPATRLMFCHLICFLVCWCFCSS